MKIKVNLHQALEQCRHARRHNKISFACQQRTLRRIWHDQDSPEIISRRRFGRLMAMRSLIEKEIKEKHATLLTARWELFQSKDDHFMRSA